MITFGIVSQIYLFMFILMAFLLLLNLLIAMMGDTYNMIAEIKNEWIRQVGLDTMYWTLFQNVPIIPRTTEVTMVD